jgi:hypothetical protein
MKSDLKIPEEFSKYVFVNSDNILCFDGNIADKKSIWSSLLFAIPIVILFSYFLDLLIISLIVSAGLLIVAVIGSFIFPNNLLLFNKKEQLLQLAYKKSGEIVRTNPWKEVKMRTKTDWIFHGQISVTHGIVPILYIEKSDTGEHLYSFTLKSRSIKELNALMSYFDDYMASRPLKEHYYTPTGTES